VFSELALINERPVPFSRMTIADLWTDPHVSEQMLRYHLDGSVAVSSATTETIDATVAWLTERFGLVRGSRVLDLGCGPGLYTIRLARAGVEVVGVDFSSRSIAYAREAAQREHLPVDYVHDDYLRWETAGHFDLVVMIMRDFSALAPDQRTGLLRKIARWLTPDGAFVFDVDSTVRLAMTNESSSYEFAPSGGFWSAAPCFEFHNWFVYPDAGVTLDKIVIVETARTRTLYNWIATFSPERLAAELDAAGLTAEAFYGNVAGAAFDPESPEFAAVARVKRSPTE